MKHHETRCLAADARLTRPVLVAAWRENALAGRTGHLIAASNVDAIDGLTTLAVLLNWQARD